MDASIRVLSEAARAGAVGGDDVLLLVRHLVGKLEQMEAGMSRLLAAPPAESMWTRQDVARFLQCSERFVDSLIADKVIVPIKIGTLCRFDPEAVRAALCGHRRTARRARP